MLGFLADIPSMSMTRPRGCARDAGDSSTGAVSLRLELPAPTTTTTTTATTTNAAAAAATSTSRVPYQEPRPPPGGLRWACLHDRSGKRGSMDREGVEKCFPRPPPFREPARA
ncbi:hypothetical protein HZU73_09404 [Apis mellifera caucasica]|nr:hypothetical protein HZU73_09404 [Apis mellifera caucasica]